MNEGFRWGNTFIKTHLDILQGGPYMEDRPRTCKSLGSPPFISHEKAIVRGPTTPVRGFINHGYKPLTNWDDPPSSSYQLAYGPPINGRA